MMSKIAKYTNNRMSIGPLFRLLTGLIEALLKHSKVHFSFCAATSKAQQTPHVLRQSFQAFFRWDSNSPGDSDW